MPQISGFFKSKINIDPNRFYSIKVTAEIKELEGIKYELVYNRLSETYELLFELNCELYAIETYDYYINSKSNHSNLYKYSGGNLLRINKKTLGEEIYNLTLKINEIIKRQSNERFKFLFKEK